MIESMNKIRKAERFLIQKLGREPSDQEIAEKVNLPNLNKEKVGLIKRLSNEPISLEKPVGSGENTSFASFVKDEKIQSPEATTYQQDMKKKISQLLANTLNSQEEKIIRLMYGLKPLVLETILRLEKETQNPEYQKLIRRVRRHRIHYQSSLEEVQKLKDDVINKIIDKYTIMNNLPTIAEDLGLKADKIMKTKNKIIQELKIKSNAHNLKTLKLFFNNNRAH